jgi:hypothetical protein
MAGQTNIQILGYPKGILTSRAYSASEYKDGLNEGGFSSLALLGLLEVAFDGDNAIWPRHRQLAVDAAWPCMEALECWLSKDDMLYTFERGNLKCDGLHGNYPLHQTPL